VDCSQKHVITLSTLGYLCFSYSSDFGDIPRKAAKYEERLKQKAAGAVKKD